MRRVAAIIAAVLPVLAGGPLRCPCRLVALFADRAPILLTAQPVFAEGEPSRCGGEHCSCKFHREPTPPERPPAPGVPCRHCPNVDLVVPPVTTGERLTDDRDPGDVTAAPLDAAPVAPCTRRPAALSLAVPEFTSAAPDWLRYCHSFRC